MIYLLDTSILILAIRGAEAYSRIASELDLHREGLQPAISIINYGEAVAFAKKRGWGANKFRLLERTLDSLTILPVDRVSIADRYSALDAESERHGLNIGQNDLWIASTAVEFGTTLLTTDADFERCPAPLSYIRFDQKSGVELSRRA